MHGSFYYGTIGEDEALQNSEEFAALSLQVKEVADRALQQVLWNDHRVCNALRLNSGKLFNTFGLITPHIR